ncbi:MAG: hypothetical protein KC912_22485, partial [Proteobacteria bacterium]|nr:hypothetical protein [Pseudomonadota bacterium]
MKRVVASTLGSLLACELALRLVGLGPWAPFADFAEVPPMSDPHPALGWVNRPGQHAFPGAPVFIAADGARGQASDSAADVGLYGGSYVFGYGLAEDQVVSVQLADRRPDLAVRNHGVPGYGTLQSQALEASVGAEAVVVYGLIDLHDARNAGAWSWLAGLERASRGQAWVQSPAAWWDGEALQYGEPTGYRHWELSESVALVALVERSV